MAKLLNPFVGRNTASLVLTPQVVASDGTLSDGVGGSVIGSVTSIRKRSENELENITSLTTRRKNNVIVESGTVYTIEGWLIAGDSVATPVNLPNALVQTNDYLKLVLGQNGITDTFYGVVATYEQDTQKSRVNFTLELEMVDPGVTNPAQA